MAAETTQRRTFEPFEFTVDEALNKKYLDALDDHHLRYVRGRGRNPPIVHPGLLLNYSNTTKSPSYGGPNTGALHSKDETEFINPAYVGRKLRVIWTPLEQVEKRGRIFSLTDTLIVDEDGREILRRKAWGTSTTQDHPIEARRESAQSSQTAPPSSPSSGQAGSAIGLAFVGRPKTVSIERMRDFSGWPAQNIHTDYGVAERAGLVAPIASATQNMGHLCELLLEQFGDEWLQTGTFDIAFLRPVYPDDILTARAVIQSEEPFGDRSRIILEVQATNDRGMPVTVGTATGIY